MGQLTKKEFDAKYYPQEMSVNAEQVNMQDKRFWLSEIGKHKLMDNYMTHLEQLQEELKQLETSASQLTHEAGIITFKLASNTKRQKLVKSEIEGVKALEAVSKQVKDDEEPDPIIKG